MDTKESRLEMRRHLDFMTARLSFFARFYSDDDFGGAQGNNQLKHGAAVVPRSDVMNCDAGNTAVVDRHALERVNVLCLQARTLLQHQTTFLLHRVEFMARRS